MEYQDALEAYRLSGEKHLSQNVSQPYISYEVRCIQQLNQIMLERRVTLSDVLNSLESNSGENVDIEEFKQLLQTLKPSIQQKQLQAIYNYLDLDKNGTLTRSELYMQMNGAAAQSSINSGNIIVNPVQFMLPEFARMTPREKSDFAIEKIKSLMLEINLKATTVFNLADPTHTQSAICQKLIEAFIKLAPQINKILLEEAFKAFGAHNQVVSKQIFLITFQITTNLAAPRSSDSKALSLNTSSRLNEIDFSPVILNFIKGLKRLGISAQIVFKNADVNGDGVITVNELRETVKRLFPETQISSAELKVLMLGFDKNKNGLIEREEFLSLIAKQSPSQTVESQPIIISYQDFDIQQTVQEIEQHLGKEIKWVLLPFLEQNIIPVPNLTKVLKRPPNSIPIQLIDRFIELCDSKNSIVQLSDMIRQLAKCPSICDNKNTVKLIAQQVKKPVKENLQHMIFNWQDGILKDEFISSFQSVTQCDLWQLLCLFHSISVHNQHKQEVVNLNSFVTIILHQGNPQKIISESSQTDFNFEMQVSENYQSSGLQKTFSFSLEIQKELQKMLESNLEADFDPQLTTCDITSEKVCQTFKCYFSLSQIVVHDKQFIKSTLTKFSEWVNRQMAGDFQEAFQNIFSQIEQICKDNDKNVLMFRVALKQIDCKVQFSKHEQIMLSILLSDVRQLNNLQLDPNFFKVLISIPDKDDSKSFEKFVILCQTRLEQRLVLSQSVVQQIIFLRLQESQESLKITDYTVWQKIKFSHIASLMIDKLENEQVKSSFIDKFVEEGEPYEITYFKFNRILVNQLKMNSINDWIYQDFQIYLDSAESAYISLQSVDIFLAMYNFSLLDNEFSQYKIKANFNQAFKSDFNQQISTYQITDDDYFRGVKTILNSEIAAIAFAERLYQKLGEKEQWSDPDFGPTQEDPQGLKSLFKNGNSTEKYPYNDDKGIKWVRPDEIVDPDQSQPVKTQFIQHDSSSNEAIQGKLGNCWFVSALSCLASKNELIRGGGDWINKKCLQIADHKSVQMCSIGVFPPIFHKFHRKKIYVIRFFKEFRWRYIVIDDKLPFTFGEMLYSRCTNRNELWVPIIEKAYAKLFGCYQALETGNIDDAIADMTGYVCEKRIMHDKLNDFILEKEAFWQFMKEQVRNGSLMGCSRSGAGREAFLYLDKQNTGIIMGHAYSIIKIVEIPDSNMKNPRKTHRIMIIRNPHGVTEWQLKWGRQSPEFEQMKSQLTKVVQQMEAEERFELDADDGIFFINYASFRFSFDKLFVATDFPDYWQAIRFTSEWTKMSSGGLPIENTDEARQRYAQNPQYLFECSQDCELFISLAQSDGRIVRGNQDYSNYPFTDRVNCVNLAIFELDSDQQRLTTYTKPILSTGNPRSSSEISLRLKLKKDQRYVIVPAIRIAGQIGRYFLSLYFDADLHFVNVKRLDNQKDKYCYIIEEFEKQAKQVPEWKAKWVQDQVAGQYIIYKEDQILKNKSFVLSRKQSLLSVSLSKIAQKQ